MDNIKKENKRLGQFIFDNHDFDGTSDEFLEKTAPLIGYVVHTFNSLDEQLNSVICERISNRTDGPGALIICKMSFSEKVDLFNRLVKSLELACNREIPSFKSLISNLRKCATLRNAVIHAEWENMNDKKYVYVKMSFDKDGLIQHYWQFTPDSLEQIIDFINDTYLSFDIYEEEKQELLSR